MRESLLDAVADGADAGRGFEDRLAVVHVGRGEHHVDHRVGRGEEAFAYPIRPTTFCQSESPKSAPVVRRLRPRAAPITDDSSTPSFVKRRMSFLHRNPGLRTVPARPVAGRPEPPAIATGDRIGRMAAVIFRLGT